MRGNRLALVFATAALLAAGGVTAATPNYVQESLDRYFRIEFEVTPGARPTVSGYVYNQHQGYTADRMLLAIERLDASGQVTGRSTTWLLGGVPAGSRGYFTARVEPAASYRVQVLAFDWIGRGGGN